MITRVTALLLVLLLSACDFRDAPPPNQPEASFKDDADFERLAVAGNFLSSLQAYLWSDAPAPRTFLFDRLTFDPGSSSLGETDEAAIEALAYVLKTHPQVRVRVLGFADQERDGARHADLRLQRAKAIVESITEAGVEASRLEAAAARANGKGRAAQLLVLQK